MPTKIRLLSNSRVKTARRCARLHEFKYELGYETTATQEALVFGDAAHGALEEWWLCWMEGGDAESALNRALIALDLHAFDGRIDQFAGVRLRAMIEAYDTRWGPEMESGEWEVLGVEHEFVVPLVDPATGQHVPGWVQGGKLDVLARHRPTNRVLVIEHKTSSEDVSPGTTYWRRLRMDGQPSTYLGAARALGYDAEGVVYDVLRKPDQKPHRATPEAERQYTQEKSKKCPDCKGPPVVCATCGSTGRIVTEPPRLYKTQREEDEAVPEYLARCQAAIAEKPEAFLLREEVVRLEREVDEHRRDVADAAQAIDRWRDRGHSPRSVDACFQYGRECSFLAVCLGQAALDDTRLYRVRKTVHPELSFHEAPAVTTNEGDPT